MHIPLAIGLLDEKGRDLIGTKILSLKKTREEFIFRNIKTKPVVSLLRDFSAPVRLVFPQSDQELLFLLAHDSDPFNRFEAAQKLFLKHLLAMIGSAQAKAPPAANQLFRALAALLHDPRADAAFKAMTLGLPSEAEIGLAVRAKRQFIDPSTIYAARKMMVMALGRALQKDLRQCHAKLKTLNPKATDGVSMGKRSLKNLGLAYLAADENPDTLADVFKQATKTGNMTDQVAALGILTDTASPLRLRALAIFEKQWKSYPLIMDKWLAIQAGARRSDVLKTMEGLLKHSSFDIKNPNRVSALIGAFAGNSVGFHAPDGSGYRFIAEMIIKIDPLNPQSAANLTKSLTRWRDYEPKRRALMKQQLEKLLKRDLSPNSHEIVAKSIKS